MPTSQRLRQFFEAHFLPEVFPMADYSKSTIYRQLERLRNLAGAAHWTFHDLRRAALTELAAVSPAASQLAAGHASCETTKLYHDVRLLAEAVDRLEPIERLPGA